METWPNNKEHKTESTQSTKPLFDQWEETFRLRDLLNQAFQLPPLPLRASAAATLASSASFTGCGFLHSMKFRAPNDPIVSQGLRTETKSEYKSSGQFQNMCFSITNESKQRRDTSIPNVRWVHLNAKLHRICRETEGFFRKYHLIQRGDSRARNRWYQTPEPEADPLERKISGRCRWPLPQAPPHWRRSGSGRRYRAHWCWSTASYRWRSDSSSAWKATLCQIQISNYEPPIERRDPKSQRRRGFKSIEPNRNRKRSSG